MVISVLNDSRSFSSPPVLRLLAMILRAYVSLVFLSSINTTRPKLPCPRKRSSVRPETRLAYFSLNSVVEHNLGSSRAVLRFDCMHPIASKAGASRRRRRVCDIRLGCPCLRRLPRRSRSDGGGRGLCKTGPCVQASSWWSRQEVWAGRREVLAACKALALSSRCKKSAVRANYA